MIQLLEQMAEEQYEIKVQPKPYKFYGTIITALAEKHAEFHI
jgi:hypothetical protein